jgi:deoxyribonuclease-4
VLRFSPAGLPFSSPRPGPGVYPYVDFSHHVTRNAGAYNRCDAFAGVLEQVAGRLGRGALERLPVHVSGIEYGPAGERRHVPLRDSAFPQNRRMT